MCDPLCILQRVGQAEHDAGEKCFKTNITFYASWLIFLLLDTLCPPERSGTYYYSAHDEQRPRVPSPCAAPPHTMSLRCLSQYWLHLRLVV